VILFLGNLVGVPFIHLRQQRSSIAIISLSHPGRAMSNVLADVISLFSRIFAHPGRAAAAAVVLAQPSSQASVSSLTSVQPAAEPTTEQPLSGLHRGLAAVVPHMSDADRTRWATSMIGPLCRYSITTPRCLAAFLGQCAVESGGFLGLEENLSYPPVRLCQVWPSRFPTAAAAAACAFQPETLANQVYAGRMGNGNVVSGDGWQFRGRGLLQLSGRTNYEQFATAANLGLDDAVTYAETQAGAAESAAWFWSVSGLNELAATWSIDLITQKINGGSEGAAQRSTLCNAALTAIGG
jgi:putative chitinase